MVLFTFVGRYKSILRKRKQEYPRRMHRCVFPALRFFFLFEYIFYIRNYYSLNLVTYILVLTVLFIYLSLFLYTTFLL